MARITFSLPDDLEVIIPERVKALNLPSVSAYVAQLIERDLESAGILPGTPAHDVREEAVAAAEIVGPDRVLAALKGLRTEAYVAAPAHAGGGK